MRIGIDCGANVGNITEAMLASVDTVYAFEPNPYAFDRLSSRFSDDSRVHCYPHAVLDKEGMMDLYFHENSHEDEVKWSVGSSLLSEKGNIDKEKSITVQCVDLCAFIKGLSFPVSILKMDVEGVECQILKKLISEGLIQEIKEIHVELHGKKIPSLLSSEEEIMSLIKQNNLHNINLDWI